jgi:hypothetical protein
MNLTGICQTIRESDEKLAALKKSYVMEIIRMTLMTVAKLEEKDRNKLLNKYTI